VITPERASQIRHNIAAHHGRALVDRDYTAEEEKEILQFWRTLPNGTSFFSAVAMMARGEHIQREGQSYGR
jgi:hypothetical protein